MKTNNFKNCILIVLFNYSNCVKHKDFIKKIYGNYFKEIIFYSDYPIIEDDKEVNFIYTNRGINGHIIFNDFYNRYKELLETSDGLFYTMDDNIINVNILNLFDKNKIIYYNYCDKLIHYTKYNDIPLEKIDNGKYGNKAIKNLMNELKGINKIRGSFSDFFYLPKRYLTKELFKYFELFSKYEVYLEVAIPSIINNIETNKNNYNYFEDIILWNDDRKLLLEYNNIYIYLNHLHYLFLHPVKFNENPDSKIWLEDIFCKKKCIIITTLYSPSNFLLNLFDYNNYDIIIVDNKDTNLKRIGCVYLNLEKQKYLFPNIEVNNIYSYYQRKRNGHIYANSKGYNEIYVITDDIILIIFILIFILIIINFSIYDRK